MKKGFYSLLAFLALVVMSVPAHATNWYNITVSTTPVTTIAGIVLAGLAVMWAVRKGIKLTNRS